MSLLSEELSSSQPAVLSFDLDIRMAEVMRDEAKSLQLCREILRIWSKQNKVKYVPPAFRGSLKYKRWMVTYSGLYVDNPRPRIILDRNTWNLCATVVRWKINLLTLAHEFVHHMQFSRSGMSHETAFPAREFSKEHCHRKYEGEAKEISSMMTDQIVHRMESGEISLLPRDGVFGEAKLWAAELLRAHDITPIVTGSPEFKLSVEKALSLMNEDELALVTENLREIQEVEKGSGVHLDGYFDIGKITWSSSDVWLAGSIIHDAYHNYDYRQSRGVPGKDFEERALKRQAQFLVRVGYLAPEEEEGWVERALKTEYWKIPYKERTW